MENTLKEIMETDRIAREKVAEKRRRIETINEEIAESKAKLDKALQKKAQAAIERTRQDMDEKLKSEIKRIDKFFADTEESLNRSYDENGDRWVKEIFEAVTK
ncbi:MAG: hypothetical protein J1F23_05520 [Oscillospiraceae bacterium]|nr:hypothetical protein [Oscillospiraceae bacterium]